MTEQDFSQPTHFDHGFAWVVALCSTLTNVVTGINVPSFGAFLTAFSGHFEMKLTVLALLGAVMSGIMFAAGILTGALIGKFGCRTTCFIGQGLASLGCIMGAFADNFVMLLATFGVLGGLGAGITFISPTVMISKYFLKKRTIVTPMTSAGLSLGSVTLGFAAGYIIEAIGWRHTLVLLASINLQVLVAVALFFEPTPTMEMGNHKKDTQKKDPDITTKSDDSVKGQNTSQDKVSKPEGFKLLDVTLLKNPSFAIFLASFLGSSTGLFTYYQLGPNRAYVQGVDKVKSTYIITAIGSCSCLGRITTGIIANMKMIPSYLQYSLFVVLAGALVITSVFAGGSLPQHILFASMFGLCLGNYEGIAPIVIMDLVGPRNLPKAVSWIQGARGICGYMSLALGGWLYDVSGGFLLPFVCLGGAEIAGGLGVLCIAITQRMREKKIKDLTAQPTIHVESIRL